MSTYGEPTMGTFTDRMEALAAVEDLEREGLARKVTLPAPPARPRTRSPRPARNSAPPSWRWPGGA
ncbi:hypothetical protein [Streptomyces wedmorensis]|uniref:hypothetical protein n=1 Tax=Streptomyces wedmorensis TaxID=43759 RepID=UPI00379248DA